MCVGIFAEIYMCTMCVPGVQRDQKKALDSLKVKLETVVLVSSYVGPGNQVWSLQKSRTALNH